MQRPTQFNALLKTYPDSVRINSVSPLAETLYTRLLAQADDLGRYYGHPAWVAGKLYTARQANGEVSAATIEAAIQELENVGLARRYTVNGERVLELVDVFRAIRKGRDPKVAFPGPEEADGAERTEPAAESEKREASGSHLVPDGCHLPPDGDEVRTSGNQSPRTAAPTQPNHNPTSTDTQRQPKPKREQAGENPRTPPLDWRTLIQDEFNELNEPELITALDEYVALRVEARWGDWKPRTWLANLREWRDWGWEAARDAVRASVRNQWRGVFRPNSRSNGSPRRDGNPTFSEMRRDLEATEQVIDLGGGA